MSERELSLDNFFASGRDTPANLYSFAVELGTVRESFRPSSEPGVYRDIDYGSTIRTLLDGQFSSPALVSEVQRLLARNGLSGSIEITGDDLVIATASAVVTINLTTQGVAVA